MEVHVWADQLLPLTASDGALRYFAVTIQAHQYNLVICMSNYIYIYFFTKWQLCKVIQFPLHLFNMGYAFAMIVHAQDDQLLL